MVAPAVRLVYNRHSVHRFASRPVSRTRHRTVVGDTHTASDSDFLRYDDVVHVASGTLHRRLIALANKRGRMTRTTRF